MPPKITFEMARGFTLYMVKAVMNGRAGEIFDDIRTQIRLAKKLPTAT
jgi:pyruvate dehydrogenase (quinone)